MATSSLLVRKVVLQTCCTLTAASRSSSVHFSSYPNTKNEEIGSTKTQNNNHLINPTICNRNPRNLEKLTLARKPKGYHLDNYNPTFWHKLTLTASRSGITAKIIHSSGVTVLTVSTSEFAFRKFLHSSYDFSAYEALGKVLARRCLESGIQFVSCEITPAEGTKVDNLLKEAERNGLCLTEPKEYVRPARWGAHYQTKPWEIIT